jgi:MFS family permease
MQPYLLQLYGESGNYTIAGAAAAIVAGAQIVGGLLVPFVGRLFEKRTSVLISGVILSCVMLVLIAVAGNFWIVLALLAVWAIVFAGVGPVRQSYINGIVPSEQRATVLSADNLMNSAGGAISQPALGKVAEVWGYPASYLGSALFQSLAIPLMWLAHREDAESDELNSECTGAKKG